MHANVFVLSCCLCFRSAPDGSVNVSSAEPDDLCGSRCASAMETHSYAHNIYTVSNARFDYFSNFHEYES